MSERVSEHTNLLTSPVTHDNGCVPSSCARPRSDESASQNRHQSRLQARAIVRWWECNVKYPLLHYSRPRKDWQSELMRKISSTQRGVRHQIHNHSFTHSRVTKPLGSQLQKRNRVRRIPQIIVRLKKKYNPTCNKNANQHKNKRSSLIGSNIYWTGYETVIRVWERPWDKAPLPFAHPQSRCRIF